MRKVLCILILALLLTGCADPVQPAEPTESTAAESEPTTIKTQPTDTVPTDPAVRNYEDIKAIWLSQYDLWDVYLSHGTQREREDFASRMAQILDNIAGLGFNTVFLQVRPNGDSMYPSEYYPMSKYVVGQYGVEAAYDPVAIIVTLARERELSVHAWINPMRCIRTEELEAVSAQYPIRQWYDDPEKNGTYLVQSGAYWYLNPAYEEVRSLIIDGAAELLHRYHFDGLHMDDYFYPTTEESFDSAAYAEFGGGESLDEFRRENLNILVAALYSTARSGGEGVRFGISPAGNLNTVYHSQYADVYTWCAEPGYVDYICPQVYFGLEHERFDFVTVCNTWQGILAEESVALVIGMTFEKALSQEDNYAGTGQNEWKEHQDVLKRCLEYTTQLPKCRGVSVFSYQHFFDPVSGEPVVATAQERENFIPVLGELTWQP